MVGLLPWPRHIYIIYIFYITNLLDVCFICKSAMMYVHHSICICAQTVYFIARSPALHFEFERPFTFILIIAVQSSHSHRLETCRSRRSRSASEHSAVEKELQWWAAAAVHWCTNIERNWHIWTKNTTDLTLFVFLLNNWKNNWYDYRHYYCYYHWSFSSRLSFAIILFFSANAVLCMLSVICYLFRLHQKQNWQRCSAPDFNNAVAEQMANANALISVTPCADRCVCVFGVPTVHALHSWVERKFSTMIIIAQFQCAISQSPFVVATRERLVLSGGVWQAKQTFCLLSISSIFFPVQLVD